MSELIVDEAGELRWEHEGVLVDGQVGVLLVAADVVLGELDDAGQGKGVETDESSRDADVQGQRGVVEAAQQLVSDLGLGLEVAGELRGWVLDDEAGRAEASCGAPADRCSCSKRYSVVQSSGNPITWRWISSRRVGAERSHEPGRSPPRSQTPLSRAMKRSG